MKPSREAILHRVSQRRAVRPPGAPALPVRRPESGLLEELRRVVAERDLLLDRKRKKIRSLRQRLEEERRRADSAEGITRAYKGSYEELMAQVSEARAYSDVQIADAVSDYRASADFIAETEEAGATGYEYGFEDCRSKMAELYPGLDLSGLAPVASPSDVVQAMMATQTGTASP